MNRLAHQASDCARDGVSRDALARQQLTYDLPDMGNLDEVPSFFPPAAQARLLLGRAPFPLRPSVPLAADGIRGAPPFGK